jgi:hypothetical protein
MTQRTSHDLQTQVRNELNTLHEERACAVSPEFVEWLMGYPRGWTAAAAAVNAGVDSQLRRQLRVRNALQPSDTCGSKGEP